MTIPVERREAARGKDLGERMEPVFFTRRSPMASFPFDGTFSYADRFCCGRGKKNIRLDFVAQKPWNECKLSKNWLIVRALSFILQDATIVLAWSDRESQSSSFLKQQLKVFEVLINRLLPDTVNISVKPVTKRRRSRFVIQRDESRHGKNSIYNISDSKSIAVFFREYSTQYWISKYSWVLEYSSHPTQRTTTGRSVSVSKTPAPL